MPNSSLYPRPDWRRPGIVWNSLNGPWDFCFDDRDIGVHQGWHQSGLPTAKEEASDIERDDIPSRQQINVPFAFQTTASGINDRRAHEIIWYSRLLDGKALRLDKASNKRCLVRFGAVDYKARVWLDGVPVGSHRGGHVPFDIDITDALSEASYSDPLLVLRVQDSPDDLTQPRGKQYWAPKPESIWYTPTSGIWQSVWQESVPETRLGDSSTGTLINNQDINSGCLYAKIMVLGRQQNQKLHVALIASYKGIKLSSAEGEVVAPHDYAYVGIDLKANVSQLGQLSSVMVHDRPSSEDGGWQGGLALWSPEHPHLYDLEIRLLDEGKQVLDTVITMVGMRTLDWTSGDGTFRLNGKPYFQALVLDQGYWPKTGLTPPSDEALRQDIMISKAMGFNGCRKHQKVEDPLFLYWADLLGYLVWGEMANAYEYSDKYVQRFNQEWTEVIKRDINHPCIVTWTPGNESWGYKNLKDSITERNHLRDIYHMTKTLDSTRPVNENCGWEHVLTDLTTFHDYTPADELAVTCATMEGILSRKSDRLVFVEGITDGNIRDPPGFVKDGAPVICTEFGGINIQPKSESETKEGDWGYTTAVDSDDLLKRIEGMVMGIVNGKICCGLVYTQLTDIEQEVNGLYTFDRVAKLDTTKMKAIMDQAKKAYYDRVLV